jgi:hypothetical protein
MEPAQEATQALLGREWVALQASFEGYERGALAIKLLTVVVAALAMLWGLPAVFVAGLVAVLWLQEGIWRTFQARVGARIERVEACLRHPVPGAPPLTTAPFQLHSDWRAARPGSLALLRSYAAHAARPTVAYPYGVLMVVAGLVGLF